VKDLRLMPWWTAADRAELNALTHELTEQVFSHREQCSVCAAGFPPCPAVQAAIGRVIQWRQARILLSQAVWLRARQDRLDQATLEVKG
jgi:hypothetical protein